MESTQLTIPLLLYGCGATIPAGSAGLGPQRGKMQAELSENPKNTVTYAHPEGRLTKVTSLRTDTTLDLSQKAEKVCHFVSTEATNVRKVTTMYG